MLHLVASMLMCAPPIGFEREVVASGFAFPIAIAFRADGRPLVLQKCGRVTVVNTAGLISNFLVPEIKRAEINCTGEMGMLGMAVDLDRVADDGVTPEPLLYLCYTSVESKTRVSKFPIYTTGQFAGLRADRNAETIIFEHQLANSGPSHHAGCLRVDSEGLIYVSLGDNYDPSPQSQDLTTLRGKILRMDSNGDAPPGNPFYGNTVGYQELIWAYGVRNPFRFSIDDERDTVFVSDVGSAYWEELSRIRSGDNLGWPLMEGPECFTQNCDQFVAPIWSYAHGDAERAPDGQAAIIAGPVYRGNVFPPSYVGDIFVTDFVNRWIRRLELDDDGNVIAEHVFDTSTDLMQCTDLAVGPDGALYFVRLVGGVANLPALMRIKYTGGSNVDPVAIATSDVTTSDEPPLTVSFDGTQSFDPDNGPIPLTYLWKDDGEEFASTSTATRTFTSYGSHQITLTVSDGLGSDISDAIIIEVGSSPVPVITKPSTDLRYRAGDIIEFQGHATDAEEGELDSAALTWSIELGHDNHFHPYDGPFIGVDRGDFVAPQSGHAPEHTYFRIFLTAEDASGASTTVYQNVLPDTAILTINTTPSPSYVLLDGVPLNTPVDYESIIQFRHRLEAPQQFLSGGTKYFFDSWSNGAGRSFYFDTPVEGLTFTANYVLKCPADFDEDGLVTSDDFDLYIELFINGDEACDFDKDGYVTADDLDAFLVAWEGGC